jgi:hypothetical protein
MTNAIEEAQNIILDLESDILRHKNIWTQIEADNPGWDQLSDENWQIKQARCWIHGATDLSESNELEKWLFDKPPLSDTAKEKASKCIKYWKQWLKQQDAYYRDFEEFELETPLEDEILRDYIVRISILVEEEGKGARLEWRALKSFLAYMRKIAPEEIAFIEQVFPQKMDIYYGRIIRKITPEVYPIPQEIAYNILYELARMATKGRSNAILSALESLGLCWLCLTASRLRLPTYLELIEKTKMTAITLDGDYPTMLVPTLFGDRKIRISKRLAKFFIALSKIPSKTSRETILQSPKRSLTRTFDRALQNCAINPNHGNITYVTLLSSPHHFGNDYRHRPK